MNFDEPGSSRRPAPQGAGGPTRPGMTNPRKARKKKQRSVPQPYLALAPAPLAAPAAPERASPGLILPSTYVRSSPVPGRGAHYATGLLSPPAIMATASSPVPRNNSSRNVRAQYSHHLVAPPGVLPGGRPASPLGPGRPALHAHNSSGRSVPRLHELDRPESPASGDGAGGGAATGAHAPAPRRRRRRRVVEVNSMAPVASHEEGQAMVRRGASMRRRNVWEDPQLDLPDAADPPPPFPFHSHSNARLPPGFTPGAAGAGSSSSQERLPPIPDSPPPSFAEALAQGSTPRPPSPEPERECQRAQGRNQERERGGQGDERTRPPLTRSSSGSSAHGSFNTAPSLASDSESDAESVRSDRREWLADIEAGYSLVERVRREEERRRRRLAALEEPTQEAQPERGAVEAGSSQTPAEPPEPAREAASTASVRTTPRPAHSRSDSAASNRRSRTQLDQPDEERTPRRKAPPKRRSRTESAVEHEEDTSRRAGSSREAPPGPASSLSSRRRAERERDQGERGGGPEGPDERTPRRKAASTRPSRVEQESEDDEREESERAPQRTAPSDRQNRAEPLPLQQVVADGRREQRRNGSQSPRRRSKPTSSEQNPPRGVRSELGPVRAEPERQTTAPAPVPSSVSEIARGRSSVESTRETARAFLEVPDPETDGHESAGYETAGYETASSHRAPPPKERRRPEERKKETRGQFSESDRSKDVAALEAETRRRTMEKARFLEKSPVTVVAEVAPSGVEKAPEPEPMIRCAEQGRSRPSSTTSRPRSSRPADTAETPEPTKAPKPVKSAAAIKPAESPKPAEPPKPTEAPALAESSRASEVDATAIAAEPSTSLRSAKTLSVQAVKNEPITRSLKHAKSVGALPPLSDTAPPAPPVPPRPPADYADPFSALASASSAEQASLRQPGSALEPTIAALAPTKPAPTPTITKTTPTPSVTKTATSTPPVARTATATPRSRTSPSPSSAASSLADDGLHKRASAPSLAALRPAARPRVSAKGSSSSLPTVRAHLYSPPAPGTRARWDQPADTKPWDPDEIPMLPEPPRAPAPLFPEPLVPEPTEGVEGAEDDEDADDAEDAGEETERPGSPKRKASASPAEPPAKRPASPSRASPGRRPESLAEPPAPLFSDAWAFLGTRSSSSDAVPRHRRPSDQEVASLAREVPSRSYVSKAAEAAAAAPKAEPPAEASIQPVAEAESLLGLPRTQPEQETASKPDDAGPSRAHRHRHSSSEARPAVASIAQRSASFGGEPAGNEADAADTMSPNREAAMRRRELLERPSSLHLETPPEQTEDAPQPQPTQPPRSEVKKAKKVERELAQEKGKDAQPSVTEAPPREPRKPAQIAEALQRESGKFARLAQASRREAGEPAQRLATEREVGAASRSTEALREQKDSRVTDTPPRELFHDSERGAESARRMASKPARRLESSPDGGQQGQSRRVAEVLPREPSKPAEAADVTQRKPSKPERSWETFQSELSKAVRRVEIAQREGSTPSQSGAATQRTPNRPTQTYESSEREPRTPPAAEAEDKPPTPPAKDKRPSPAPIAITPEPQGKEKEPDSPVSPQIRHLLEENSALLNFLEGPRFPLQPPEPTPAPKPSAAQRSSAASENVPVASAAEKGKAPATESKKVAPPTPPKPPRLARSVAPSPTPLPGSSTPPQDPTTGPSAPKLPSYTKPLVPQRLPFQSREPLGPPPVPAKDSPERRKPTRAGSDLIQLTPPGSPPRSQVASIRILPEEDRDASSALFSAPRPAPPVPTSQRSGGQQSEAPRPSESRWGSLWRKTSASTLSPAPAAASSQAPPSSGRFGGEAPAAPPAPIFEQRTSGASSTVATAASPSTPQHKAPPPIPPKSKRLITPQRASEESGRFSPASDSMTDGSPSPRRPAPMPPRPPRRAPPPLPPRKEGLGMNRTSQEGAPITAACPTSSPLVSSTASGSLASSSPLFSSAASAAPATSSPLVSSTVVAETPLASPETERPASVASRRSSIPSPVRSPDSGRVSLMRTRSGKPLGPRGPRGAPPPVPARPWRMSQEASAAGPYQPDPLHSRTASGASLGSVFEGHPRNFSGATAATAATAGGSLFAAGHSRNASSVTASSQPSRTPAHGRDAMGSSPVPPPVPERPTSSTANRDLRRNVLGPTAPALAELERPASGSSLGSSIVSAWLRPESGSGSVSRSTSAGAVEAFDTRPTPDPAAEAALHSQSASDLRAGPTSAEAHAHAHALRPTQSHADLHPPGDAQGDRDRERQRYSDLTDVDLYVARLQGSGREFEGLTHVEDFLGPAVSPGASPAALETLVESPVVIDSRRVNAAGKVKLKMSVLGGRVSSCPVCMSQFRGGDVALALPNCGHVGHKSCVREWMKRSAVCMVCRHPVGDEY